MSSISGLGNLISIRPALFAKRPRRPLMRATISTRPFLGTVELRKAIGEYLGKTIRGYVFPV